MGLFQFTRMPFGLTGAPSSFQRLMDKVCCGLPFTLTYLDDFLIYSPLPEEHIQHLREVFTRLQQACLTLKGPKCHLGLLQVTYLGHIFSATGMKPDPSKLSAIQDWPMPTSVSEVHSFLGLASYYRRYMDQFAEIATPLYRLTRKNTTFNWNSACQTAFTVLKQNLAQAPVLAFPSFEEGAAPFLLQTDSSAIGLGAVLEQNYCLCQSLSH